MPNALITIKSLCSYANSLMHTTAIAEQLVKRDYTVTIATFDSCCLLNDFVQIPGAAVIDASTEKLPGSHYDVLIVQHCFAACCVAHENKFTFDRLLLAFLELEESIEVLPPSFQEADAFLFASKESKDKWLKKYDAFLPEAAFILPDINGFIEKLSLTPPVKRSLSDTFASQEIQHFPGKQNRLFGDESDRIDSLKACVISLQNEVCLQKDAFESLVASSKAGNELRDAKIRDAHEQLELKESEIKAMHERLELKDSKLKAAKEKTGVLEDHLSQILSSRSWRMTKPLRAFFGLREKEDTSIAAETQLNYQIDSLIIKPPLVSLNGWAFFTKGATEELLIRVNCQGKDFYLYPLSGLLREDVEAVYPCKSAYTSGFSLTMACNNAPSFSLFLQIKAAGATEEIFIDTVKMPQESNTEAPWFGVAADSNIPQNCFDRWEDKHVLSSPRHSFSSCAETIDIVLPIYNGFEYFDTLFESIARTDVSYRLIIVDDCSTDKRVLPYLQEMALRDSRILLERNEVNRGFVKTANRGFSIAKNHVALINSDIVLPEKWLERLMRPILQNNDVASSTPFTNSGTICSFPEIGKDNDLFEGLSCQQVDDVFSLFEPTYTELPTGVGFCMGLSARALEKVGSFDAETFGRGYGEENDWCQRCIESGFRNVLVENLFVYHEHGGSFSSKEKASLIQKNLKLLQKKHPHYGSSVASFFSIDPAQDFRSYAALILLTTHRLVPTHLVFNHDWGGGATAFLEKWEQQQLSFGKSILQVQYHTKLQFFYFTFLQGSHSVRFRLQQLNFLDQLLQKVSLSSIQINELVSYPNLNNVLEYIIEIKARHSIPIAFYLHDYYSICPTINLMDRTASYCALNKSVACDSCLTDNPFNRYPQDTPMNAWRQMWKDFLEQTDEVIAFSQSSAELLQAAYPELQAALVRPHKVTPLPSLNKRNKTTASIHIGLLGNLNECKGGAVVQAMLKMLENDKRNIQFVLFGQSLMRISDKNFRKAGDYSLEELPLKILENDIDIVFIASVWPETFSFTTAETIEMGLPIASFDLGAQGAQVQEATNGLLLSRDNIEEAYHSLISFAQTFADSRPKLLKRISFLFIIKNESAATRYRVHHFREQLLFAGITSDICFLSEVETVDVLQYSAFIVHKCQLTAGLSSLTSEARTLNRRVYYDICDLSFDETTVSNCTSLSPVVQEELAEQAPGLSACMLQCDALLTSTSALAELISKKTSKPVFVSKSLVDMETEVLSLQAVHRLPDDKIVICLMENDNSDSSGFMEIELALVELMGGYPAIHLETIGAVELSTQLNDFNDRITQHKNVDRKKVPQLLAQADICIATHHKSPLAYADPEIQWMEAALVQVPTVLMESKDLEGVLLDNRNCLLFHDSHSLIAALTKLIDHPELRLEVAKNAYSQVVNHHTTRTSAMSTLSFVLKDDFPRNDYTHAN